MDAYPRARTWPQVLIVSALFIAAAIGPRWWRSLEPHQRRAMVSKVSQMLSHISLSGRAPDSATDLTDSAETDFKIVGSAPRVAVLKPPVAQRVVIEPTDAAGNDPLGIDAAETGESLEVGDDASSAPDAPEPDVRQGKPDSINASGFELHHVQSALPDQPQAGKETERQSEWPHPTGLLAQLDELCSDVDRVERWRTEAIGLLAELNATMALDNGKVPSVLSRLSRVAVRSKPLELDVQEPDRVIIRQIAYGIERRVAIWRSIHAMAAADYHPPVVNVSDALPLLRAVSQRLADADHADDWHNYLKLERLHQIATSTWETDASVRHEAARDVLQRMQHDELTPQQQRFLAEPAIVALASELRVWAQAPIELPNLTQTIEQFETARSARLASRIVKDLQSLHWIDAEDARLLSFELERHYRNANIRIAITDDLMNNMLPVLEPIQEQVRDQILGASVRGRNNTWTRLKVRLMNSRDRIRLRFEAAGNTTSNTVSTKGPIRFYSRADSVFQAGKELSLSRSGLRVGDATAVADGQSRLTNVKSEYDSIPLLGWVLRQIAVDELQENRGLMRREVNGRVSRAARQRLDESLKDRVEDVQQQVAERLLDPLRDLQLEPTALEMQSTPDRMVMRCRIASKQQLAAYTPRPRALGDSVLSIQLHESSANNLFQQLDLSGKRFALEDLMHQLSEKLQVDPTDINTEFPEDVRIRLGHDRPIQVQFEDDRVRVTIRIAELVTKKNRWRSFVVHGRYRADVNRMHIDLEREEGIELVSDGLAFRDQIALRGIFTKVMAKNHRLNIMRGRFVDDPRLAKLRITQFVVRDGWIGISVGPQRAQHIAEFSR